jgi:hypothetical protein
MDAPSNLPLLERLLEQEERRLTVAKLEERAILEAKIAKEGD